MTKRTVGQVRVAARVLLSAISEPAQHLRGRFPVIQFKTGGNTDPSKRYQASYEAETDFITLTADWERHAIPIGGKDLTSVISAFTFVLRAEDNPNGAVFFLDDIEFR